MQQLIEETKGKPTAERRRVEAVVETLSNLRNQGETVAEVAHDARNMVTALALYCDLLEEPGVLAAPFSHYGSELRLVAAASRRLVERLVEIDNRATARNPASLPALPLKSPAARTLASSSTPTANGTGGNSNSPSIPATFSISEPINQSPIHSRPLTEISRQWDPLPSEPIRNLAAELLANRNLLSSMAGPAISLSTDIDGGARPVRLSGEDLTRVLINLVRNATAALPSGGLIHISLREQKAAGFSQVPALHTPNCLVLTIEDNGPGIPEENLERIFVSGFTAPAFGLRDGQKVVEPVGEKASMEWPSTHRGLGLAITRSIVEAAGGRITAANRPQGGARFTLELPTTK